MPPARRQLHTLGSLQLVGHANNPTKVITELAFITDKRANATLEEGTQSDADAPLEVQFDEFMDGVNSRGKGTKTRQRMMTVEQAAAVLLVTVQKGYVELVTKADDPQTIDVIKILPEAKIILAAFLPKLRGYGDIPYDYQYRGAIALARRHFFPKGKAPTKKELMGLLLQSYQEKRELQLQCQARLQSSQTLGIQTSLQSIDNPSHTETGACACADTVEGSSQDFSSSGEPVNNSVLIDTEPVSEVRLDLEGDENHGMVSETPVKLAQLAAATPVAPRSFNPYLTPVSNPRHADVTAVSILPDQSPTRATFTNVLADDGLVDGGRRELLQVMATSRGKLDYYYNAFVTACRRITFLESENEDIQRKFDATKRKLDETEQSLLEANANNSMLKGTVKKLGAVVNSLCGQVQGLTGEVATMVNSIRV